ncbi:hypothetical protein [Halorarum halobium]|uniref:hypothetical protein n=1 Tax=Halorarum halobium TaxID=3075121 RepID=UPI0028AA90F1|nr:hypothetical protein [Halobaculum sp. XH14]
MSGFRDDLRGGFEYVAASDRLVTTVVVGTVLLNFSYLLFPVAFLMGYFARVLAGRSVGVDRPPGFVEWRPLLVTGTKASLTAVVGYGLLVELAVTTMSQWLYPAVTLWSEGRLNVWELVWYALTPLQEIRPAWWSLHVVGLLVIGAGSLLLGTSLTRSSGVRRVAGWLLVASALVPVVHYLLYLVGVVLLVSGSLPLGFPLFGAAVALLGYETWRDQR